MSHSSIAEILRQWADGRTEEEIAAEIERRKARLAAKPQAGDARALDFSLGTATAASAASVRDRVRAIVAKWAGLGADAVPASRKISEIWDTNPRNPRLDEGTLSVLVRELRTAFPGVDFVLGAVAGITAAELVQYVENRA
ncbi:MAG TPA: hypothetical protein VKK31_01550 [Thermoanaerobaculia bacterium]|nr:hypothetical protein [Thermoanaerobaculia bacterium]